MIRFLILFLGVLLGAPQAAYAQATPASSTRLCFVFSAAGKAELAAQGITNLSTWATARVVALNQAKTDSQSVAGYQYGQTMSDPEYNPGPTLATAAKNLAIAKTRANNTCDGVVVVDAQAGPAGDSLMDCSKTGQDAAELAFAKLNLTGISAPFYDLAVSTYVGRLSCATHAQAYRWTEGGSTATCTTYYTSGWDSGSHVPYTVTQWSAVETGLVPSIVGNGPSAFDALSVMAARCGDATSSGGPYSCSPISCTPSGSGASCSWNRTAGNGTTTTIGPTLNATSTSLTCPNLSISNLISNTTVKFNNGYPTGDATHNNVATIDARAYAQTSTFDTYLANIVKKLTAAVLAAETK